MIRLISPLLVAFIVASAVIPSARAQQSNDSRSWKGPVPLGETVLYPSSGFRPAVGFSGEMYLVVTTRGEQIFGVRLDIEGTRLDRVPFLISDPAARAQDAAVAWNGQRFLVVWRDAWRNLRGTFIDPDTGTPLPSVRIGPSGSTPPVVSSNGATVLVGGLTTRQLRLVFPDGAVQYIAAPGEFRIGGIASDGDNYLVATENSFGQPAQLLKVVEGRVLDLVSSAPPSARTRLEWVGDRYLLLGRDATGVHGYEVAKDGTPLSEPVRITGASTGYPPLLHPDGAGGALIVLRPTEQQPELIRWRDGRAVSARTLELGPFVAALSGPPGRPLVLYQTDGALWHSLMSLEGDLLRPAEATFPSPAWQWPAHAAATQTGWFTVWREQRGEATYVRASILSARLVRLREFDVSETSDPWSHPAVAVSPRSVLVVWSSRERGLEGQRFTHSGEPLDQEPFPIASDGFIRGSYDDNSHAAIAWNGRYFLLAAQRTGGDLRITRITPDGVVLDPEGIPMPGARKNSEHSNVRLAVAGEVAFLVWQDGISVYDCSFTCTPAPPGARIEGVPLDIEGNPMLAESLVLSNESEVSFDPWVAGGNGRFLVVWRTGLGVMGLMLGADGHRIDQPFTISPDTGTESLEVSVTAHNDGFFVVWDSLNRGGRSVALHGEFISRSGALLERIELAPEIPITNNTYPLPSVFSRRNELLVLFGRRNTELGGTRRNYLFGYHEPPAQRRGVRRR